jgi:peroxiredoxin
MAEEQLTPLGPGDRAPEFDLPAADREGRIVLADYLRRGPVVLTMIRGLYCPFCRRHISQLKPTCETLQAAHIEMLGIVIATPERARRYFSFGGPPCFPIAAAPDRVLHRAYGLGATVRTPEMRESAERRAAEILRDLGMDPPPGRAAEMFAGSDGFVPTAEDEAEWRRPLQTAASFLIRSDGVIRWAKTGLVALPKAEDLLALL